MSRALRVAGPLADEGLVSYLSAAAGTVNEPRTGGQAALEADQDAADGA